jgi:GGDEF domain-containing protein
LTQQIIAGLLSAENFFIALVDADRGEINFPHFVDERDAQARPLPLDSRALCAEVIRTDCSLLQTADAIESAGGREIVGTQSFEWLEFVYNQVAAAILRTQLHARLLYAAGQDELTGLASRALLQDRLQSIMARVRRKQARFAVLCIDLDNFKEVKDLHDHNIEDPLLQEVARRLRGCIRESDTIARFGGDEFVVLLDSIISPAHAQPVAHKINAALSVP